MSYYKYFNLEDKNFYKNINNLLAFNQIYLAKLSLQNDLFEGAYFEGDLLDLTATKRAFKKSEIARKINSYRIYCFSKTNTNLALWSHYAKIHTGICIKFNLPKSTNSFTIRPIKYVLKKPRLDETCIENILKYKYSDWKYEREHRIIINEKSLPKSNLLNLGPGKITEIYLGKKIKLNDAILIFNKCKEYDVKCFYAKNINSKFKIEFKEILSIKDLNSIDTESPFRSLIEILKANSNN